jgi:hypothetical protein
MDIILKNMGNYYFKVRVTLKKHLYKMRITLTRTGCEEKGVKQRGECMKCGL